MAISKEGQSRLERLAAIPEKDIDTSDIPEVLDWSGAIRVGLYKARKEAITIWLNADVPAPEPPPFVVPEPIPPPET